MEVPSSGSQVAYSDTDSHAIPSGIRSSEQLGAVKLLLPPTTPTAFLSFCSCFLSLCLTPAFHKEISRQVRLETTIVNSVDPLHPGFVPPHAHFSFPK